MNDTGTLLTLYLWQNNERIGPYPIEKIQKMLHEGSITSSTLAASSGDAGWSPLSVYPEVFASRQPAPAPMPEIKNAVDMDTLRALANGNGQRLHALVAGIGVLCMLYFAFVYDITVRADSLSASARGTVNIGLVSNRETGMIFGAALFLGGCILSQSRKLEEGL